MNIHPKSRGHDAVPWLLTERNVRQVHALHPSPHLLLLGLCNPVRRRKLSPKKTNEKVAVLNKHSANIHHKCLQNMLYYLNLPVLEILSQSAPNSSRNDATGGHRKTLWLSPLECTAVQPVF